MSRIQEKYASIPDDLGRDLKAAQSYIKKHEGFENELVALEVQVIMAPFDFSFLPISDQNNNKMSSNFFWTLRFHNNLFWRFPWI